MRRCIVGIAAAQLVIDATAKLISLQSNRFHPFPPPPAGFDPHPSQTGHALASQLSYEQAELPPMQERSRLQDVRGRAQGWTQRQLCRNPQPTSIQVRHTPNL